MPYTTPHILLQWTGQFQIGASTGIVDQWTGSMRLVGPGVNSVDITEPLMTSYWNKLTAFLGRPASMVPSNVNLSLLKMNKIGVDGKYASKFDSNFISPPRAYGAAQHRYPTQIAWATTWNTQAARGLARQGRSYWPTAVATQSGDRTVTVEECKAMAASAWTLIADLNSVQVGDGNALVCAVMSDQREGATHPITYARVGNRLDVQRRRANNLDETYYDNLGGVS